MNKEELSIDIRFFLSLDETFSEEDSEIVYSPNNNQKQKLGAGISNLFTNTYVIDLATGTFKINMDEYPHLRFYCGRVFLLAQVVDLKNVDTIDPDLRNNIAAKEVYLICDDLLSLESFQISLQTPQHYLYGGVDQDIYLDALVWMHGVDPIKRSYDNKPNIFLNLFASPDSVLDFAKDSAVTILEKDLSIENKQYSSIYEGSFRLKGKIKIHLPYSACTSNYLILSLSPGVNVVTSDNSNEDNIRFQDIRELIACAVDSIDIMAENLIIQQREEEQYSFSFDLTIQVQGETEHNEMKDIEFQFYLSKDEKYDITDRSLEYSSDHFSELKYIDFQSSQTFSFSSDNLTLPTDLSEELCGNIFILILVDSEDVVVEPSEYNNVVSQNHNVKCFFGEKLII